MVLNEYHMVWFVNWRKVVAVLKGRLFTALSFLLCVFKINKIEPYVPSWVRTNDTRLTPSSYSTLRPAGVSNTSHPAPQIPGEA